MKERPILFSGAMVSAILEGRKTQTRRAIKHQNLHILHGMPWREKEIEVVRSGNIVKLTKAPNGQPFVEMIDCPYGQPGDRLWVRETWAEQLDKKIIYRAEYPKGYKADFTATGAWKPSIFMPRVASRITLEITNIRAERLNQISEADAIAEGIELLRDPQGDLPQRYKSYIGNGGRFAVAVASFKSLWESINGACSFGDQWVWVVEFKRV
jgi:hypothetical protein